MLGLIVTLVLIGLALYVLQMFVPIDGRIKQVIYILVGLWLLVTLLSMAGVQVPYLGNLR
jgi:hypothetical protein